jgi:hypothetical protein
MTHAERHITARLFGVILAPMLFLLCPLTLAGQSEQKQGQTEDTFVAQHREATRKNPEGISFTLRLEEDKVQFKPGEIIRVEFSFASDLPDTYDLDVAIYDRRKDKYFLDHKNGVVDPLRDYPIGTGGGLSAVPPPLSEKPRKMTFDLNEWFRFDQPGRFRLYVTAPRILKKGAMPSVNGADVTSTIVEFEILPRDNEWAEQELQAITRLLDSSDPKIDRSPVCRRLRFLNTEAAANEMISRFEEPPNGPLDVCGYEYSLGLRGSAHRAFIVNEMERRLEAPDQIVSGGYLRTLSELAASLRQKERLPSPTERPNDERQAKAADEAWRKQWNLSQKLQAQYTERLISALSRKQRKARAIAAHTLLETLWNNSLQSIQPSLTNPGQTGGLNPEIIKKLAPEIIELFDDLPVNIQRGLAIQRLYELAPDEGRRLIIRLCDRRSHKGPRG